MFADAEPQGQLLNRSPGLGRRREAVQLRESGRTTIYEWTVSSSAPPVQLRRFDGAVGELHDAVAVGNHEVWGDPLPPHLAERAVQRRGGRDERDEDAVHAAAERGLSGGGGALPHADAIQASFGRHDVSGVTAHLGSRAESAANALGAQAYTTGSDVAFARQPDLHLAAHEAAHVVQQRAGVQLRGGVGEVGDAYEQHADQVADAVVAGRSAEGLLDRMVGTCDSDKRSGSQKVIARRQDGGLRPTIPMDGDALALNGRGLLGPQAVGAPDATDGNLQFVELAFVAGNYKVGTEGAERKNEPIFKFKTPDYVPVGAVGPVVISYSAGATGFFVGKVRPPKPAVVTESGEPGKSAPAKVLGGLEGRAEFALKAGYPHVVNLYAQPRVSLAGSATAEFGDGPVPTALEAVAASLKGIMNCGLELGPGGKVKVEVKLGEIEFFKLRAFRLDADGVEGFEWEWGPEMKRLFVVVQEAYDWVMNLPEKIWGGITAPIGVVLEALGEGLEVVKVVLDKAIEPVRLVLEGTRCVLGQLKEQDNWAFEYGKSLFEINASRGLGVNRFPPGAAANAHGEILRAYHVKLTPPIQRIMNRTAQGFGSHLEVARIVESPLEDIVSDDALCRMLDAMNNLGAGDDIGAMDLPAYIGALEAKEWLDFGGESPHDVATQRHRKFADALEAECGPPDREDSGAEARGDGGQ